MSLAMVITHWAREILSLPNASLSAAISASMASYSASVTKVASGDLVGLGVGLVVGTGSVGDTVGCGSVGALVRVLVGDEVGCEV